MKRDENQDVAERQSTPNSRTPQVAPSKSYPTSHTPQVNHTSRPHKSTAQVDRTSQPRFLDFVKWGAVQGKDQVLHAKLGL